MGEDVHHLPQVPYPGDLNRTAILEGLDDPFLRGAALLTRKGRQLPESAKQPLGGTAPHEHTPLTHPGPTDPFHPDRGLSGGLPGPLFRGAGPMAFAVRDHGAFVAEGLPRRADQRAQLHEGLVPGASLPADEQVTGKAPHVLSAFG